MKIQAAARLRTHATPKKPAPKWRTKDAYGPPCLTLAEAKAKGYTEGPYYHGTSKRGFDGICAKGFRSKGAKKWETEDIGYVEEFEKWDTVDPVMFTPDHRLAALAGKYIVECYVKPGRAFSADHLTLMGGLYVKDPSDLVPIKP